MDNVENRISESCLQQATRVLAAAEFSLPLEARALRLQDDFLPNPDDPGFAPAAARFRAMHPLPPPHKNDAGAWDIPALSSRQCKCMAYLASGRQEKRLEVAELCAKQAMRLQLELPVWVGWDGGKDDRSFCAAAASLAFTGKIVQTGTAQHSVPWELAGQWVRTGLGQLTTYGNRHDETYRAVAAALVETSGALEESPTICATDDEFFRQIDLDSTEMSVVSGCVDSADWRGATDAYVKVLSNRLSASGRRGQQPVLEDVDIQEADDICRNVFILKAHMFRRHDFGAHVDWSAVIDDDIESRVWMNAHAWAATLLGAYRQTGDDKYIEHLCRLLTAWYQESPPPLRRSDAQWRTLEVGGRPGRWADIFLALAEHPVFQERCLFNMARSVLDHGKYLCMYAASHGNWLQVESSGLVTVALLFPEFKLSPLFRELGMGRLLRENDRAFLPDGFQSECSTLYHLFPVGTIRRLIDLARLCGQELPEQLVRQCERWHEAAMHMTYPNGCLPLISDCNAKPVEARDLLSHGAQTFDRPDFAFVATRGKEGSPPAGLSHDFTHAGYCAMRSGWDADAHVLIFDAGYFGAGHQHEDKLSFVYHAFGRELIGDPGIYSYKNDEFESYWRGTWSHNSVVIDALSQHRDLGPPEDMPDPDRRFVMGEGFDFAAGWYRRAYSPRKTWLWGHTSPEREKDATAALRNVQHQRCIFFVKGRYAIVCDRLEGEGEHGIDIIFRPEPIVTHRSVRPVTLELLPDGAVITRELHHANVAILPADTRNINVLDLIGQKNPVRGWHSLYGINPSHEIVFRCRRKLPAHLETIIQPLARGEMEAMKVSVMPVESDGPGPVAALRCGNDLFLASYGGPARMRCTEVDFEGTALLLEGGVKGPMRRAFVVDGTRFSVGRRRLLATDAPVEARSLDVQKP